MTFELPVGLKKIAELTFMACEALQGLVIPPLVNVIDDMAFCHCSQLTNVALGKGLKKFTGRHVLNPFCCSTFLFPNLSK
jgi:hypothetical protein